MSRRNTLIALLCVEALVWLVSAVGVITPLRAAHITGPLFGAVFILIEVLLRFGPAVWVGALSRQWQGAIALNLIALLPALAVAVLWGVSGAFGANGLAVFGVVLAFGVVGWLLRFIRLEFAEEGQR